MNRLDAEKAVMGCLLLNNRTFESIPELEPHHFSTPEHVTLYRTIMQMLTKGSPADTITLMTRLQAKGELENVGGLPYLTEIATGTFSPSNIANYAAIVVNEFRRFELKGLCFDSIGRLDSKLDPLEVGGLLVERVGKITENRAQDSVSDTDALLSEHLGMMERRQEGKETLYATGLSDLDKKLGGGFSGGDLVILAARPAMGKTALALSIALNMAESRNVLFFSLEMMKSQLMDRAMSNLGSIPMDWMRNPCDDQNAARHTMAFQKFQNLKMMVDDKAGRRLLEIQSIAKQTNRRKRLGLIVVDYLGLIRGSNAQNRNLELGEYSKGLKALAKDLDLPVLCLAQLNRAVDNRAGQIPHLADLRDSGEIEADADTVMFIHREEYYKPDTVNKGLAEIIIAKQRQGETGFVGAAFQGKFQRFDDLAYEYQRQEAQEPERKVVRGFK